ncbi:MAG: tRNA (adenosine(37)-N6)-threonylcarbamoyltransferase complex transferase subunit TsaD [Pseudomonadota bacterium]
MIVLGLEASCDETAASVVRGNATRPGEVLSNTIFGQEDLHRGFGGVVPEIAARAHAERADLVVARALKEAGLGLGDLDAIAVTAGPGLIGGVMAGVMTAKGIAAGTGLPLIGINHLEGHALTPRLTDAIAYPYLLLLVSGGHCQLIAVEGLGRYSRLGGTIDDAPGEAFDKTARILSLGFPGGPEIERVATNGDAARFALPRPLMDRPGCDMSFSGLKTAIVRARDELIAAQDGLYRQDVADLAASFQAAVGDVLATKTARALKLFLDRHPSVQSPTLAVAGGVAANTALRKALERVATDTGAALVAPPLKLCTDNGAMIAWTGIEHLTSGSTIAPVIPRPRWPLDDSAAPMLGSGKKGPKA